ncbi:protein enabled homolog [Schistocerca piceifrons]|uniref:protein enabled homolog n=1 Tax=Schistocerca piceifrons TaxID=274613 RepID=UPI001F5FC9B7|nr:protein enabled homolog [Schistocerca piceifrons]
MCPSPEYLYAFPPPPPPGYDMMGYVPLEPPGPPEDPAAQTAAIIASQSQDYVDEKLAEYQATIQQLQVYEVGQRMVKRLDEVSFCGCKF